MSLKPFFLCFLLTFALSTGLWPSACQVFLLHLSEKNTTTAPPVKKPSHPSSLSSPAHFSLLIKGKAPSKAVVFSPHVSFLLFSLSPSLIGPLPAPLHGSCFCGGHHDLHMLHPGLSPPVLSWQRLLTWPVTLSPVIHSLHLPEDIAAAGPPPPPLAFPF